MNKSEVDCMFFEAPLYRSLISRITFAVVCLMIRSIDYVMLVYSYSTFPSPFFKQFSTKLYFPYLDSQSTSSHSVIFLSSFNYFLLYVFYSLLTSFLFLCHSNSFIFFHIYTYSNSFLFLFIFFFSLKLFFILSSYFSFSFF